MKKKRSPGELSNESVVETPATIHEKIGSGMTG